MRQNAISQQASNEPARQQRQRHQARKARQQRQPHQRRQPGQRCDTSKPNQTQVNDQHMLLAKKGSEISMLRTTIRKLNERLGSEDLTSKHNQETGEYLLSSSEDGEGSENGDADDGGSNEIGECANSNCSDNNVNGDSVNDEMAANGDKENAPANMQRQTKHDMMFSFAREFIENVNYLFTFYFPSFSSTINLHLYF